MTATITPQPAPDRLESEEWPAVDQEPADPPGEPADARSFDPTQGRKIGSAPYDDPTQGHKIGSDPYDDPTHGRKIGSSTYDDPTQGPRIGAEPHDDPTQGSKVGSDPNDDPTRAGLPQPASTRAIPTGVT